MAAWIYGLLVEDNPDGEGIPRSSCVYRYTPHGVTLLERSSRQREMSAVTLDPQTGAVLQKSETDLKEYRVAEADAAYSYVVANGNLYAIAHDTLAVSQVWP